MKKGGKAGYSEVDECDSNRLWRDVIWSEKVRCSSKIKPRFRAEWEVSSEELCILASCILSPTNKNLVLDELRVRRLAVYNKDCNVYKLHYKFNADCELHNKTCDDCFITCKKL